MGLDELADWFFKHPVKAIFSGGIGLLTLIGGCTAITNNWKYSDGARIGKINKVSEKGFFFKTYEAQMALEGIVSGEGSVGANVWDFSVDFYESKQKQEELFKKLLDAARTGQRVEVQYLQVAKAWPWRGSTDYFVRDVQPILENAVVDVKSAQGEPGVLPADVLNALKTGSPFLYGNKLYVPVDKEKVPGDK